MTAVPSTARPANKIAAWRTPGVIIVCGCAIAMLSFGPRSAVGQFLAPMSLENHWGRDVFAFALAIQNLLWGAFQPFAGAVADRYGAVRVLWTGAIAYAAGLALMAQADTPGLLDLTAGVLIGFALSSCSFNLVIGALGKLVPESWRSLAFGAGTAAGSFGQFLFSPLARALIDWTGWQNTLVIFGGIMLLILPLALALATPRADAMASGAAPRPQQSVAQALTEAFAHRSYVLLVLGFFTCGFQLAFITLPASTGSALVFGAVTGFLWLSTVPPTSGLVALMFGTRWLSMLFGFAFFSHQVGGFLGVWLGGIAFDRTGSYDAVWWLSVLFGVLSALINLPIVEKPVARAAVAPA